MKVQVYNSNEKLVFEGSMEQFSKFQRNDSDRVLFIK